MNPFWVVQSYSPRMQILSSLAAQQLERRGYLVQIAQEMVGRWDFVRAHVVLAVKPRWHWWLEFVRGVSYRFRKKSGGVRHGSL